MAGESSFAHEPVLVREITELFAPVPAGVLIDGTVGGGGHARALLEAHPQLELLGLDQDDDALAAAATALASFGSRVRLRKARFDHLSEVMREEGIDFASAVLLDLGVSSPQLDRPDRGFSYRHDGPLDMRMDRSQELTAADRRQRVRREATGRRAPHLRRRALRDARRRRHRRRSARAHHHRVGRHRSQCDPRAGAPPRRSPGASAPSKRSVSRSTTSSGSSPRRSSRPIDVLAPTGRCAVLAYHSGEDRIVKSVFRDAETGGCVCPPNLPCACGAEPKVRLLKRGARKPSPAEVEANPRAESARLRAVEKLAAA